MSEKIVISINETKNLVAEIGADKDYKEIFIYLTDDNGNVIRDIAVCRPGYFYNSEGNVETKENTVEILLKNGEDTDFEQKFVYTDSSDSVEQIRLKR